MSHDEILQLIKRHAAACLLTFRLYNEGNSAAGKLVSTEADTIFGLLLPHMAEVGKIEAAMKIQGQWRNYQPCLQFRKLRKATVVIQSMWRMRMAKKRAQIRRQVVEINRQILLEEERRKAAAKQKLREIEEKMTKKLEEATKVKIPLMEKLGVRGMNMNNSMQEELDSEKQNKQRHHIQRKTYKGKDSQGYDHKHLPTHVKEQHRDRGYKHKEKPWKRDHIQECWDSSHRIQELTSKDENTCQSKGQNGVHNDQWMIHQFEGKECINTHISIDEKLGVMYLSLSCTYLRIIKPPWEHGMLWVPSPSHQMSRGEVELFFNKVCECRVYVQASTKVCFVRVPVVFIIKESKGPWKKQAHIRPSGTQDNSHPKEATTVMILTHKKRHKEEDKELRGRRIPKRKALFKSVNVRTRRSRKRQWRKYKATKEQNKDVAPSGGSQSMDLIYNPTEEVFQQETEALAAEWLEGYQGRTPRRQGIMDTSKRTTPHEDEGPWEHIGKRHKWPNICYEVVAGLQGGVNCYDQKRS